MILELAMLISIVANFGASAIEIPSERGSFCTGVLASTAGLGDEQIKQIFEIVIEKLPPEDLRALLENPLAAPAFSEPDLRLNEGRTFAALLAKMEGQGQLSTDELKNKWNKTFSEKLEAKLSGEKRSTTQVTKAKTLHRPLENDFLFDIHDTPHRIGLVDQSRKLAVVTESYKYQLWDLEKKEKIIEIPNLDDFTKVKWSPDGLNVLVRVDNLSMSNIDFDDSILERSLFLNATIGRIDIRNKSVRWLKAKTPKAPAIVLAGSFFNNSPRFAVLTTDPETEEQRHLEIWDSNSGKLIEKRRASKQISSDLPTLSISPDNTHFAIGFDPLKTWLWDRKLNKTLIFETPQNGTGGGVDSPYIKFSNSNKLIIEASDRKSLRSPKGLEHFLDGSALSFLPKEKIIYISISENSISIRNLSSQKERQIPIPGQDIRMTFFDRPLVFSANGKFLFSLIYESDGPERVRLLHFPGQHKAQEIINIPTSRRVHSVEFSEDKPILFIFFSSGEVRQVDLSQWEETP